MIIEVTGGAWGENGVLVIHEQTSELLIRTPGLPSDVVLKTYLAAVRGKKTAGVVQGRKEGRTYQWKVLGQPKKKRQPRRGWGAAVVA